MPTKKKKKEPSDHILVGPTGYIIGSDGTSFNKPMTRTQLKTVALSYLARAESGYFQSSKKEIKVPLKVYKLVEVTIKATKITPTEVPHAKKGK